MSEKTTADPRAPRRRINAWVGAAIGTVLAGGVGLTAATVVVGQALGDKAWRSGDLDAAERWFGLTDRADLAQRWIAPYNLGVVAYANQEWRRSADLFARAEQSVPASSLCRVVLNQSLALEALGDAFTAGGDQTDAARTYREAKAVIARAEGCSEESSSSGGEGGEPSGEQSGEQSGDPSGQPSASPSAAPEGREEPGEPGEPGESGESGETPGDGGKGERSSQGEQGKQGEDGQQGAEDGQQSGEGQPGTSGSEQQQVDAAAQRLSDKLGEGTSTSPATDEGPESQARRLTGRNQDGAREQQESRDSQSGRQGSTNPPGKTW